MSEQQLFLVPLGTQSPSLLFDVGRWAQLALAEVQLQLMTEEERERVRRLARKLRMS